MIFYDIPVSGIILSSLNINFNTMHKKDLVNHLVFNRLNKSTLAHLLADHLPEIISRCSKKCRYQLETLLEVYIESHMSFQTTSMFEQWAPAMRDGNGLEFPKGFVKLCQESAPDVSLERWSWYTLFQVVSMLYTGIFHEEFSLAHCIQLRRGKHDVFLACGCINRNRKGKLSLTGDHEIKQRFFRQLYPQSTMSGTQWTDNYQQWESDASLLLKVVNIMSGPTMGADVQRRAARVDKVGLLQPVLKHFRDKRLLTSVSYEVLLMILLTATDFQRRKEFTLDSQVQGALNPFLNKLYNLITSQETLSREDKLLIVSIIPSRAVIRQLHADDMRLLATMVTTTMGEYAPFMDAQFTVGAREALCRGGRVHSRTHASHTGSTVNSTAWNVTAGALSNLMRFYNLLTEHGYPLGFFFPQRCPCLVANDQFEWGSYAGVDSNDTKKDLPELFKSEVSPFASLLRQMDTRTHYNVFLQRLDEADIPPARWVPPCFLSRPESCNSHADEQRERHHGPRTQYNTFSQPDLVNGIAVHPSMTETVKSHGCFGYTPYTGT